MPDTLQAEFPTLRHRVDWWVYVLAGVLVVAAVLGAERLASGPATVPGVTVRNDTAFEVTIAISATPNGDVTPLGILPPEHTETFRHVVDHGRTWYFHMTSGGVDGGTLARTRADLAHSGWTIVVDGEADARFRVGGLVPDPDL
jgi:hypothetical protein